MDDVREALSVLQNARNPVDRARAEAWLIATAEGDKTIIELVEGDDLLALVKRMQAYGEHDDRNYPPMMGGDDYIEMAINIADGTILQYFLQSDSIDNEGWVLFKDIRKYAISCGNWY